MPPSFAGAAFMLVPAFAATLLTGSDAAGAIVTALVALVGLVRPHDSWILTCVLFAVRTIPFLYAAFLLFSIWIGSSTWTALVVPLLIGGVAHLRIEMLARSGRLGI